MSRRAVAEVLRVLLDEGFRFTVIGGTVVELALGSRDLGDDVDLFTEEPSVLDEGEFLRVGEEYGWIVGQTWLGTPRLVARARGEDVPVEFYDNLYDFYVPPEIVEASTRIQLDGVRVRVVSVEDHIVLKANSGRGSDMERLKEIARLYRRGRIRIDRSRLLEAVNLFDEPHVLLRRLRDAGFKL
ncbi:MAG: nucleotidyltransferase [Desulfurococcales archaeon]|nr:nucleotidyltransferase [Desulfurococcales archaeon]